MHVSTTQGILNVKDAAEDLHLAFLCVLGSLTFAQSLTLTAKFSFVAAGEDLFRIKYQDECVRMTCFYHKSMRAHLNHLQCFT